ncbi:MAG: [FeFe] hydrogenase H-cluster maturation GTPase HydF [Odoribacteraceae bacterium]|jgi:[FeFe] hydrogenase H-cluster maturation GTPase HydF|nr:[FeFe] hydrogenase H-cluster maturation GTPase HydF [Odoribacteraceae bacterium]
MGKENKLHVILLGRRNNGKSALLNALTGQQTSIVSDTPGTTTDPVRRGHEIPGLAPVTFIDTAGIDDHSPLGKKRAAATARAIEEADIAIIVITANRFDTVEQTLARTLDERDIPYLVVHNKRDQQPLLPATRERLAAARDIPVIDYSATLDTDTTPLLDAITATARRVIPTPAPLAADLLAPGEHALLVIPVDTEAPTGRLILPQVQLARDLLDHHCIVTLARPGELHAIPWHADHAPRLVITDSQAFARVAAIVPPDISLTSFSIILARHKGPFDDYLRGTPAIDKLRDNHRVLVIEACSHHVTRDDIARHKLPAWIRRRAGQNVHFDFVAGRDPLPRPVTDYALVIHCGGCMATPRQIHNRLLPATRAGVPVTNLGMAIAYLNGIFDRVTRPLVKNPNTAGGQ